MSPVPVAVDFVPGNVVTAMTPGSIVGGPHSHALLTGLTGMGLAWYVTRPDIARAADCWPPSSSMPPELPLTVWNSPLLNDMLGNDPDATTWIAWAAIKGLPFLILLALLVRVAMRRE